MGENFIKWILTQREVDNSSNIQVSFGMRRSNTYVIGEFKALENKKIAIIFIDFKERFNKEIHGKYMRYTMTSLKQNFVFLKCLCFDEFESNSEIYILVVKLLQENAPNLQFLGFDTLTVTEPLLMKLYLFFKNRDDLKRPLDLQILNLEEDLKTMTQSHNFGYLTSLLAALCKNIFHTEIGDFENTFFMRNFLTAADLASRKETPSYVSTGLNYNKPTDISKRVKGIWKYANVRSSPKDYVVRLNTDISRQFYNTLKDDSFLS